MSIASRETPRTDAFEAEHRNVDDMTAAYAAFEFARTLEGELEAARQRIAELDEAHQNACKLVAQMHYAATGMVTGPKRGVVEDIADLRDDWLKEKTRAEAAERDAARWREALEYVENNASRDYPLGFDLDKIGQALAAAGENGG